MNQHTWALILFGGFWILFLIYHMLRSFAEFAAVVKYLFN